MIQFDAGNTEIPSISGERSHKIVKDLLQKREDLGFIDVDITTDALEIQKYVSDVESDFDNVVILGIGGSALGTKALLESLHGKYYNEIKDKKGKNIYILDNIDPETFSDIENIVDISRTLFVFISKSGGTIETLTEYIYFKEKCQNQSNNWERHFCFIVGENCSMRERLEEDFRVFYIPENIGGRFSVFTAVGLLPLAFTGSDIGLFQKGMSEIKKKLIFSDLDSNIALQLAHRQLNYYKQGKNICVFFPYSSRLFQVGEWYKQLMGESVGKEGEGITLTSALGVTDQHSQLQLFQDGPNDKLYITVSLASHNRDIQISKDVSDFTFSGLLEIEKYGTVTSLKNENRPVLDLSLEKLDEENIAELLYTLMFQIAYLGELMQINAFDQPGVEKSKIITKEKLKDEIGEIDMFQKAFYD